MLEGFLHHKEEEKEYLCALLVSEERIDAALWETVKSGKTQVLKTSQAKYQGGWEEAIKAADTAITEVEESLPENVELTKVVFGLFPHWLKDDAIKEDHLKQLKSLTKELSLTPLGFVELPIAIAHLLQQDEGVQQTVILVGLESSRVIVSLFKIGKLIGSQVVTRSHEVSLDVEKGVTGFTDVEVLPSRILLYGTVTDKDSIKDELLNYPWQKKANFLHFPKIEVLPDDFPVKAVAISSSIELNPHPEIAEDRNIPGTASLISEKNADETSETQETASDLGFMSEAEIAASQTKTEKAVSEDIFQEQENLKPPSFTDIPREALDETKSKLKLPKFKINLPKFTISLKIPRIPKLGFIAGGLLLLGLAGVIGVSIFWILPKARVEILVSGTTIDKTKDITGFKEGTSVTDTLDKLLVKEISQEISGSKSLAATGKKTVGEKAKGEVTIFNKTLNPKNFKKGTELTSGNLKFTLEADVSIASASENVGSLTYGSSKAAVSAIDIGTAGNLSPGSDFTLVDLPTSSYSARNDKVFSGGLSREIAVVSRDDQKQVKTLALKELNEKFQVEIKQKLTNGEKLIEKSVNTIVQKETFSKEAGEETDEVQVNLDLKINALSYNETDLNKLVEKAILQDLPENYEFKKEDVNLIIDEISEDNSGVIVFKTHIKIELLPKIETEELKNKLAGRSISEASDYLKSQANISGVGFAVTVPFPSMKQKLPLNPKNIDIRVSSLK